MTEILQDLSAQRLAQAIEDNGYAFTPFSHKWPGAEVHAGVDLCWCITDIPFDWCNVVFNAHLKVEEVDDVIGSLIAKARKKKVSLRWFVGHDSQPGNLGEYLLAHGFVRHREAPGMAINLNNMHEIITAPSTMTITEVKNAEDLKIWCQTMATGFSFPEGEWVILLDEFTRDVRSDQPIRFYLAWLDGKPIATSLLFLAEGVAGIYFVATVPDARRQGLGFAITLKPLQEARALGYHVGVLGASSMGEPVYLKMGFKEYARGAPYHLRRQQQ